MKIKEGTKTLGADSSMHGFEVVDKTDEVSSKHHFEVVDRTDEVSNHTYDKPTLTWFEEIFEEYKKEPESQPQVAYCTTLIPNNINRQQFIVRPLINIRSYLQFQINI